MDTVGPNIFWKNLEPRPDLSIVLLVLKLFLFN